MSIQRTDLSCYTNTTSQENTTSYHLHMYIALFFCPLFQSLDFSSLLITSSPILKFNFVINIHYCMLIQCLLQVLSWQWHSTYCSRNSIINIWQPKSLKDKKKNMFLLYSHTKFSIWINKNPSWSNQWPTFTCNYI